MGEFDGHPLENPETSKTVNQIRSTSALSKYNLSQNDFTNISRWFKKTIGNDKIDKIQLTNRLKSTPAVCSAPDWGFTASHEELIRANTVHDKKLQETISRNKKILELNPDHPIIYTLFERIKNAPTEKDSPKMQI